MTLSRSLSVLCYTFCPLYYALCCITSTYLFSLPFLLLRSLHTDTPCGFGGGAVPYPGSEQPPKETHCWDSQWDDEGPEWVQHHSWKQRHQAGEWERVDTHFNPHVSSNQRNCWTVWQLVILQKVRFKMLPLLYLKCQFWICTNVCGFGYYSGG